MYGWAGLEEWNNADTVTSSHLFQTWYDGEEAYINGANRPARYLAMRDTVDRMLYQVKLPVLAFAYQFGFIDSLALQDGRLSDVNGILTDNNLALPYFAKQINIAGLATEDVFQNKIYLLYFDPSIVFNNTAFTIQSITVVNLVTNSQYFVTATNGVAVQFASSGINTLRFTVQLSNGSSYTNYQRINVKAASTNNNIGLRPSDPDCTPVSELLTSNIPFQGYTETDATNSHADVHFYYHTISPTSSNCERVLRKPIIIVDGFDPENTREYWKIYKEQLSYIKNQVPTFLGDDLRDKGYDVIILNFPKLGATITDANGDAILNIPATVKLNGTSANVNRNGRDGGADYIERNAMLLVKLIQDVNATLAANGSTEKIVIVGPSMGGLVSRYALAYMEKQQAAGVPNMNHNCRVWVSFDSPHDGANIAIGVQQSVKFLGYTGGDQKTKDNYDKKLRSIAARQQLIEQMDGVNGTASFYTTFYSNLKNNGLPGSNGFPMNTRRVNLLNGSGSGIDTYWPGAEVLNGEAFGKFLGIQIKGFDIKNNFLSTPGTWQRTSKTMILNKKKLQYIKETWDILNTNTRGSMDAVQGGLNNEVINTVKNGIIEKIKEQRKVTLVWANYDRPNFCFVPTISALGFKQPVPDWHARVDNRNLLCTNEINFDSYYLPPTSEKHIFLTEANVNWVMQEIEKGQQSCPTICSFSLTGGGSALCVNTTLTYTLDVPAPSGTTVQWIVPANFQIISSNNSSVTVKAIASGESTVKAIISNPCGANVEIAKSQFVSGVPSFGIVADIPCQPGNIVQLSTFSAYPPNAATIYHWRSVKNGITTIIPETGPTMSKKFPVGGLYLVYAIGENSCGTSTDEASVEFNVLRCTNAQQAYQVMVSPNPANGKINLNIVPTDSSSLQTKQNLSSTKTTSVTKISLYEVNTNLLVKQWVFQEISKNNYMLNIPGLKKGVYIVSVEREGNISTAKVIIL